MVESVWLALINKGQFPYIVVLFLGAVYLFRLPEDALLEFGLGFLRFLESRSNLGWILFFLLFVAVILYCKFMRQQFSLEVTRVADERNALQAKTTDINFRSSEDGK